MIDDNLFHLPYGWLAMISGPMFSGKSEELITTLRRADIYARLKVQAFKPVIDNRYGQRMIISHDNLIYPAVEVEDINEIQSKLDDSTQLIGISEGQFLDDKIIEFCIEQKLKNKKIIVEGLTTDFRKEAFKFKNSEKTMMDLLRYVEYHFLKTAFCYKCGKPAIYTMRKIHSKEQVFVGGKESYAAACEIHHQIP
jgi:thymidine kinase